MNTNRNSFTDPENKEDHSSIESIIPAKSFWYLTGVIPVIALSFDEQHYQQLLSPFPLRPEDINTFSRNFLPHNDLVPSANLKIRMWIVAQFYGIDDYIERRIGKHIVKTADDSLVAYNMAAPEIPTNLLVIYSSTSKLHNLPAPKYKPFPLLLTGSTYVAYFCIPFGICGTKKQVNRFSDRIIDRYPERLAEKASNYLSHLLHNRLFSLPPILDEDLPDFIGDLHEDLMQTLDISKNRFKDKFFSKY